MKRAKILTKDSRGTTRIFEAPEPVAPPRGRVTAGVVAKAYGVADAARGAAKRPAGAIADLIADSFPAMLAAALAIAMVTSGALPAAPLFGVGPSAVSAAAAASPRPLEHLRGIYLQRAIEIATVGTRTIHLTRFTRFRRCGRFRGVAEDFNDHMVDVTGRDVAGYGFVAGFVDTIEGCAAPKAGGQTTEWRARPPSAATSRPAAAD